MKNLAFSKAAKKSLTVALLTALILLAGLTPQEARADRQNSLTIEEPPVAVKIALELRGSLNGEDYVEALVELAVQADTRRAAEAALRGRPFSDIRPPKLVQGAAVVEELRRTAAASQQDIRCFLEQKKKEGALLELQSYYIVNMLYVKAAPAVLRQLAGRPEVKAIYPNRRVRLAHPTATLSQAAPPADLPWNISCIGAPAAWAQGVDGEGVVVGILDTGVLWEHAALKAGWRGYDPAEPENPDPQFNWYDPVYGRELPGDLEMLPHGTHVAGTILGSTGNDTIGVAPGAKWIAAAAFIVENGEVVGYGNDLLAAAEYLLAPTDADGVPHPEKAPDIINNSWCGGASFDEWFREMVQSWRDAGILPVFAAGNDGPAAGTINNPGHYPESFAVAAVDSYGRLAEFSSRGPGPYEGIIKPQISAPGVSIYSSVPGGYECWGGTSMAAPHIAGAAALLLQANPHLQVAGIEQKLIDTAQPLSDSAYPETPNYGYGYGLVDIAAAIALKPGDLNGNGVIEVSDAIILLRSVAGLAALSPIQDAAADLCPDGKINVGDAVAMLRYIVGLVPGLPLSA